jgi:molybdenum cofactor cytidylyltransferase
MKKIEAKKIGAIVMAAGSSSRMGKPKQLLIFQGKTLLERAIAAVEEVEFYEYVLVLGGNADQIQSTIDLSNLQVLINHNWSSGMSSSMQLGLNYLIENHQIDAVVILLCDQPFTDREILNSLIRRYKETKKGIIASKYGETLGVPALFDKKYFGEMLELKPSEGAKKIIFSYREDMDSVDFPLGAIDIDTQEDYEKLINSTS